MGKESDTLTSVSTLGDFLLPLINRYHSAWLELNTRISMRQHILQLHIGTSAILYGFYFNYATDVDSPLINTKISLCFLIAEVFITLVASIMMWMQYRVMQTLCKFLSKCEELSMEELRRQGKESDDLFYFYSPRTEGIRKFHGIQRKMHRILSSLVFLFTVLGAAALTWGAVDPIWSTISVIVTIAGLFPIVNNMCFDEVKSQAF